MQQRVSVITLGVADLARARRFYEALGWSTSAGETADVIFFQAGGLVLSLWDRDSLADDSGVQDGGGWGGMTLAHNVASPEQVDALMADAQSSGAAITRAPGPTFWGGYSGVFVDLDGHPWEIAHNPHWTLNEDGSVRI